MALGVVQQDDRLRQHTRRRANVQSGRCQARRLRGEPSQSAAPVPVDRPIWWIELLLVLGGYGLYHEAQIHAPTTEAIRHGWDVLRLERWGHLGVDSYLNRITASSAWVAVPAEYYYATLHFVVTVAVLIWLWKRHPESYRKARRVIVAGTIVALAVFWAFPTAPPRLLPHAGFIDTSLRYRIPLNFEAGKASHAADLYAAMPSLHFAWSLWCAWAISRVTGKTAVRRLVWLYPTVTALVVMSSANHFALDLAGGATVLMLGALLAVWLPERLSRGLGGTSRVVARRRWAVMGATVAGPVALGAVLVSQPHLVGGAVDAMLRAQPVWLIAAVGAEIASMSAFSRLQARSLHMTGYDVRHRTALAINYASNAISSTIPIVGSAAGTANTWRQYQRRGVSPAAVTWALATAGVLSTLSFSLLMALAALTSGNAALVGAGAGVTLTALGLAAGYVAIIKAPTLSERLGRKLEAAVSGLASMMGRSAVLGTHRFVENLTSYRATPGSLLVAGGAGFLNWTLDVACLGLSIRAVGGHLSLTVLVVVWATAGAASSLSFTPSGLGVVEPILLAGLAAAGLHHDSALAATALYRLVSLFLVAAAGWFVQLSLTRHAPAVAPALPGGQYQAVPATPRPERFEETVPQAPDQVSPQAA